MKTTKSTEQAKKIVAEICMYGTREIGAGYIATTAGVMLGDGEPRGRRSFTDALWLACQELREAWTERGETDKACGTVRVFAPGGEMMAEICLWNIVPCFGDLKWSPAIVHVIDAAEIVRASEVS